MTGPTRRRALRSWRRRQHHHLHRQLLELLGVVALGGWHWRDGEDKEGGWRAVKSEYAGTGTFTAYCRPDASSFGSSPGTIVSSPLLDGR